MLLRRRDSIKEEVLDFGQVEAAASNISLFDLFSGSESDNDNSTCLCGDTNVQQSDIYAYGR